MGGRGELLVEQGKLAARRAKRVYCVLTTPRALLDVFVT